MTEDRLNHLLAVATDLSPSAALRSRVATLRPKPRLPWFALPGAAAALAAIAFLATPRTVSATELIQRADRAIRANLTFRAESERLVGGHWVHALTGLHAPGWRLYKKDDGTFNLLTPKGIYHRFQKGGPVVYTRLRDATLSVPVNDPSPEAYVRSFRLLPNASNAQIPMAVGEPREEDGRRVRDVVLSMGSERLRFVLDSETDLPRHMDREAESGGVWQTFWRVNFAFPGDPAGSKAFTRVLDSGPIVDSDALGKEWTRRLTSVQQVLRPPQGKPIAIRDQRTLPNGDVLILYTGPEQLTTSLEGPQGEPYAFGAFTPNSGFVYPRVAAPVRPSDQSLHGLWFVPLRKDVPAKGPVRLSVWRLGVNAKGRSFARQGEFWLRPPLQREAAPPYRDAFDDKPFDTGYPTFREAARINALANRWVDGRGRSIDGMVSDVPSRYPWIIDTLPPVGGVRHDPKAVAEATRLLRDFVARAPSPVGGPWDAQEEASTFATLNRWARAR